MGLDVSTHIIVGAPLLDIGSVTREEEMKQLVNALGEPTGELAPSVRIYLTTKNGKKFLIGSNRRGLSRRDWRQEHFSFEELLGLDEDDIGDWIHASDLSGDLDQFVIGRCPKLESGPTHGRYDTFRAARFDELDSVAHEVSAFLKSRFGYSGEVYVVSQTSYSY